MRIAELVKQNDSDKLSSNRLPAAQEISPLPSGELSPHILRERLQEKRDVFALLKQGGYSAAGTVLPNIDQALADLDKIINNL